MLQGQFWRRKNAAGLGYQFGLFSIAATGGLVAAARGQVLFVANSGNGTIGEYNASTGAAINPTLISGLDNPTSIAISRNNLFVVNNGNGVNGYIGEYTTTGQTVNAALVPPSTFFAPDAVAVSGSDLFVSAGYYEAPVGNAISEYTTSGGIINADFVDGLSYGMAVSGEDLFASFYGTADGGSLAEIPLGGGGSGWDEGWPDAAGNGLAEPMAVAVSDSDVYVYEPGAGRIDEYTFAGDRVVNFPASENGMAIYGSDLFLTNPDGTISEYSTSGQLLNTDFITGLDDPSGIAFVLPEPSWFGLLGLPALLCMARRRQDHCMKNYAVLGD